MIMIDLTSAVILILVGWFLRTLLPSRQNETAIKELGQRIDICRLAAGVDTIESRNKMNEQVGDPTRYRRTEDGGLEQYEQTNNVIGRRSFE